MPVTVGITGGIGSGKTTVCKVFRLLGAPVFEADVVAKQLLDSDPVIKKGLTNLFGADIYTADAGVNRKKLATIIFNDEFQLLKMNELVHPVVRKTFHDWKIRQTSPYVVHEAAILFESGFYNMMDFTILVTAPEEERIQRVTRRNGWTREQVLERINKQWGDEEKRKRATIEINNGNRELILPRIIELDKQLRAYGKIW